MLNKSFQFYSESLDTTLTVDVVIEATNNDESEVTQLDMYDSDTGDTIRENQLTNEEIVAINEQADALASDSTSEAYQDYLEELTDRAYDDYKDRMYYDE